MDKNKVILLVVGVAIAVGVGFMIDSFLNSKTESIEATLKAQQRVVPPTIPTARVLVAKKDLVVGTFVKREDLHWQLWPEESISPIFVSDAKTADVGKSKEKLLTIADFVGGVVRMPIAAGQPMIEGLVANSGERGFLAAVLQPGMRAMSVPVSATSGISGFILPGDHVDILWDVKKSSKGYPFTQTLFRDIRVIAIDTKTSAKGATPAKTLTLEFTPFQTEAMSLAQTMGGIEFTLRSIVPETDNDSILEGGLDGGLLAQVGLGRSDGIEAGALLGSELLAVAREKEIKEIARDSWTVQKDLLFGRKGNTRGDRGPLEGPSSSGPTPVSTGNR
ncbi:MAG: Flp pilus assembly protein CpaB, partial [Alphaproteobacteria bacterium]|nr:Flp pilus assembly protein CpaB [Alphaproteobacteria bacterium]